MSLNILFQMDPVQSMDFSRSSSLMLALEAQERGHNVYYCTPDQVSLENNKPLATIQSLKLDYSQSPKYELGEAKAVALSDMDAILIRQDPPFDMAYITNTYILEHLENDIIFVNRPSSLRNFSEKMVISHFPDLIPPTLVTKDINRIRAFNDTHGKLIMKPLYGNASKQIFVLDEKEKNLGALMELYDAHQKEPLILQKFISEITEGNKMIFFVDGKVIGGVLRTPKHDGVQSHPRYGIDIAKLEISKRDQEICDAISPFLKQHGLTYATIDIIGDYLIEINVTSPGSIPDINPTNDLKAEKLIIDMIEKKHENIKS